MEGLDLKYESATKALASLRELVDIIEKEEKILHLDFIDKEKVLKILRDSLIQRFEYSVDTLWKYLKEYLFIEKGISLASPKPIFRSCLTVGLLGENDIEDLLGMVNDRNSTSHGYNEDQAEQISKKIPRYCRLIEKVLKAIKD